MAPGNLDAFGQTLAIPSALTQAGEERTKSSPHPGAPNRIGRYTILEEIGAGAMGVVYAAYDTQLDRKIALKVLHGVAARGTRQRLVREAQALARVSHPNVVTVHEIGEHEEQLFLAMEFVRGQTLENWLLARPPGAPWQPLVEMLVCAGRGLAAAHQVGLIHRDFKPQNVLVGEDGLARVVDFGLARLAQIEQDGQDGHGGHDGHDGQDGHDGPQNTSPDCQAKNRPADQIPDTRGPPTPPANTLKQSLSLTQAGAIMGTPAYMAIEQFCGQEATPKSDQFAFCVTLFEALEGHRPFVGTTLHELAEAVGQGPNNDFRPGNYPAWLAQMITRGLAPNPKDRWPSMEALLTAIDDRRLARDSTEQWLQLRKVLLTLALAPPMIWSAIEATGDGERLQASDALYIWMFLLGLTSLVLVVRRREAFRPGTNRRVSLSLIMILIFIGVNRLGGVWSGHTVADILFSDLVVLAAMLSVSCLHIGPWLAYGALLELAGAALILWQPNYANTIFSGAAALLVPLLIYNLVPKHELGDTMARRAGD